jgi:ATP phosphoribosyltransferase
MNPQTTPSSLIVRISLPSKGRLNDDCLEFLAACGLRVYRPNPRQYEARIPAVPELIVLFQRPGDIVVSVCEGSVDFGITGIDVIEEKRDEGGDLLYLHDNLNFGHCSLTLAVPEDWNEASNIASLREKVKSMNRPVRIATKYPRLTAKFLEKVGIDASLILAEGTLETAPAIGYADMISDLVSSGQTLRDNHLKPLGDGVIQPSQAALISNSRILKSNPQALRVARFLLEYFDAHLRANENMAIFANMRGSSPEEIARLIFGQPTIAGLQGPTISKVYVREETSHWYAVNIIVPRARLFTAVSELRSIGGSGVVVMPVSYIFEEEPPRYTAMLQALEIPYERKNGNAGGSYV